MQCFNLDLPITPERLHGTSCKDFCQGKGHSAQMTDVLFESTTRTRNIEPGIDGESVFGMSFNDLRCRHSSRREGWTLAIVRPLYLLAFT